MTQEAIQGEYGNIQGEAIRSGRSHDLISFVTDHMNGGATIISPIFNITRPTESNYSSDQVQSGFWEFAQRLTGKSKQELAQLVESQPPTRQHDEHHLTIRHWEQPTVITGLILGVRTATDDKRGEQWEKTYYLKASRNPVHLVKKALWELRHPLEGYEEYQH